MYSSIEAVIFDMDGVLIDSEPLWRLAMIKGFSRFGMILTDEDCRKTTGHRLKEVILYWLEFHKKEMNLVSEIEEIIIVNLCQIINEKGTEIEGVLSVLEFLKSKNIKVGLATSSSNLLMNTVLEKLQIHSFFSTMHSAEFLEHGKPHPEVFLKCANELRINPNKCLVIEDSINGMVAAKAAFMQVIVIPEIENFSNKKFELADYKLKNMNEVLELFKTSFK
jgi:mannitol-1-/sugar-/sorbitol-6-/2-deoxyglucose-6-phosphatase